LDNPQKALYRKFKSKYENWVTCEH
jgi:hypothetical protein